MITKIYIPVVDINKGIFSYDGKLSNEEYERMIYDNFQKTDKYIDKYMNDLQNGIIRNNRVSEYDEDYYKHKETEYEILEGEVFLQDSNLNDINKDYLLQFINNGEMFLLSLNINPNSIEYEASCELNYWLDDTKKITEDESLDDMTKIKLLPIRNLYVDLDKGVKKKLNNCKIVKDNGSKEFPYNFIIMVEKIN